MCSVHSHQFKVFNLFFWVLIYNAFAITEEDDVGDTASEMASTMSERTGYSAATDTSTTMSVQDALNSKTAKNFLDYTKFWKIFDL